MENWGECAQHDLHMERTTLGCDLAHDMCVVLLLQGDDFVGNFTFTTHTHWFPTLYNLWPSCKPIIVLGYQLVTECWLLLPPRSFQLRFFAFFATNEQSPWHLVPRRDTGSPQLDNCFLWKDQQMERATPKFSCLVALQLLHITFSTH